MTGFEVRAATAADAPGIRRLFTRTFGTEMPPEEWSWKFERDPDGWFGTVAVADGEIAGTYLGWGMRFLLDGLETLLYSVGDVATDRSVRSLGGRHGVYHRMADAFYEEIRSRGVPFCFGFPNPRALEISHRLVGSRTLFPVRQLVFPVDGFPPSPLGAAAGESVGESFDGLWSASAGFLTHAAVRDRARANWRFHARPTRYYRMVWLEESGAMRAWAALSVVGPEALVADHLCFSAGGDELSPLFSACAAEARRLGARRLVFWETPSGPARAVLARLAGEPRDAGFPMIVRAFDDGAADRFAENVHLVPALYDLV